MTGRSTIDVGPEDSSAKASNFSKRSGGTIWRMGALMLAAVVGIAVSISDGRLEGMPLGLGFQILDDSDQCRVRGQC